MKVVAFILLQTLRLSSGLSLTSKEDYIFNIEYEDSKPNYSVPAPDMIRSNGYPCEIHRYTTKDGYINTLHRIPKSNPKGVVFVQHGLFGSSADFVLGAPKNSLGYYLSDIGYDVWLGNARGNLYSRLHKNLTTKDHKYWQFSWMEMGKYDIPAAVDYVLHVSNKEKIFYIGHSMGTTMFWAALNDIPNLKDKIELMVALAPVAKVYHMISPMRLLAPFLVYFQWFFRIFGVDQFKPTNKISQFLAKYACDQTMIKENVCENILFLFFGFDEAQSNKTLLPYILGHEPAGTSVNTVAHFVQLVNSGRFCKYDYGSPYKSTKAYGIPVPPDYDLKKVDVKVALMWANNDWLAHPKDVQFLIDGLPKIIKNYKVPYLRFNHIDFIFAIDAPELVFKPIAEILAKNPEA